MYRDDFRNLTPFRILCLQSNLNYKIMEKYLSILTLLLSFYFSPKAQTTTTRETEDKMAIRELLDTFSILADHKETQKQTLLFTENGTSETFVDGKSISLLTGRKQIGEAFANFLNNFETVYHQKGSQTIFVEGDKATGISYCLVTLIGTENGKKMKTAIGVYYNDEFVRENGHWLFSKRKATFAWQDKKELGQ
jgi:hypothetical protein